MDAKSELIGISISFKVPPDICEKLISVSNEMAKLAPMRSIPAKDVFASPHITIYVGKFPKKNLRKVIGVARAVSKKYGKVCFDPKNISIKGRYVAVNFHKTDSIQKLHEEIVKGVNDLREGTIKERHKDPLLVKTLTKDEQANITLWGYPYVMESYFPHLTVVAVENEQDAPMIAKSIQWDTKFCADSISVLISRKVSDDKREHNLESFNLSS